MIKITGKPISTSKKIYIFAQAEIKNARANKNIIIAAQEEQQRQNKNLYQSQFKVVK